MDETPRPQLSRRGVLGRAGAVGAAAVIAPAVLAACGGDYGADAEVVGEADYEPGSAEPVVELGPET